LQYPGTVRLRPDDGLADNQCPSRNGASHPISALGSKIKSSKYQQYVSGLNSLSALNSGEIHHFWTDTTYIFTLRKTVA
jgi:hypothetical protein